MMLALSACLCAPFLLAQTSATAGIATINIDTSRSIPIGPGFSGVNADLGLPVEYWDYNFNAMANTLGFGWVRFPGGTSSDIYDWKTGEEKGKELTKFSGPGPSASTVDLVAGRGGAKIIDAANRANLLGASLVVCVNGFTDKYESAGRLAKYVKENHISVSAWELSNEAYLFPGFFLTATDYLDDMRKFRNHIKREIPDAVVSIFAADPAKNDSNSLAWNAAIAAYPDKYWDAISYHHYPASSQGAFSNWIADETGYLVSETTSSVDYLVNNLGPHGVKILNTEFDPSIPNRKNGSQSKTDGTVWGGIYAVEYIMRMSTKRDLLHVGPSEISYDSGVFALKGFQHEVTVAAENEQPIDTLSPDLDFGFYVSAQGAGLGVLNGVLKNAVESHPTNVVADSVTVPATSLGTVPALYAMSYSDAQGRLSVVITNKSASPHMVTIQLNGADIRGKFNFQVVHHDNPAKRNDPQDTTAVVVEPGTSGNPIVVPPYSVLRADVATPQGVSLVNAASLAGGPIAPLEEVQATFNLAAPDAYLISIRDSAGRTKSADLSFTSPTVATFVVPAGLKPGPAEATVFAFAGPILFSTMEIASAAPGVYSANRNGAGAALALAGQSIGGPFAETFTCTSGVALSCLAVPIEAGGVVDLFGTGICAAQRVKAFVEGKEVPVQACINGEGFIDADLVTISVPSSLAGIGEASVYLTADGVESNMTAINLNGPWDQ